MKIDCQQLKMTFNNNQHWLSTIENAFDPAWKLSTAINYTKWFINRVAISTIILHKIFKNVVKLGIRFMKVVWIKKEQYINISNTEGKTHIL